MRPWSNRRPLPHPRWLVADGEFFLFPKRNIGRVEQTISPTDVWSLVCVCVCVWFLFSDFWWELSARLLCRTLEPWKTKFPRWKLGPALWFQTVDMIHGPHRCIYLTAAWCYSIASFTNFYVFLAVERKKCRRKHCEKKVRRKNVMRL